MRSEVEGEFTDDSVIVLFDFTEHLDITLRDEVDGNTLTTEAATTTNTMEVVFHIGGEIEVDDDVNVVDVDTTGNEIGGAENTGVTITEVLHNLFTFTLGHVGVDGGDGVVGVVELLRDVVDLSAGVDEDDGLGNGDGFVEIHESFELVVFFNGDVELLDTIEGEGFLTDENTGGVTHELLGEFEDITGHGGGEEADLDITRHEAEDFVNLFLETLGEHFIGFIENHNLHHVSAEGTTLHDVEDTTGSTNGDDSTGLDLLDIILNTSTTNEGLAEVGVGFSEVVTDAGEDFVGLNGKFSGGRKDQSLEGLLAEVKTSEGADGEGTGLTSTGLSLSDDITLVDEGNDGTLLNGGGLFETVRVDTAEEKLVKWHIIEGSVTLDINGIINEGVVIVGLSLVTDGGRMRCRLIVSLSHFFERYLE